ncbi:N-acetylmuramoyl-L-alanine amidase family protein [Psychroflexus halocasei]|uniref:N-acetylmuramoyl-L-alanine amidase n=1 Tax=Psychroflexus halocasei TaxID=908615 RepID=A0A1H3WZE0_9FLAO|nr:N-acetylmuramoyl-L-alanine amidase [Psychroflexus halocasei]SDZ92330.1 N-acetylmuramoyl-L-alanine amidase [Psychroflexus halocasei]
MIKKPFIFLLIFSFSIVFSSLYAQSSSKFNIVLDAGHGGEDSGNTGNGYSEKDIALKIVLKMGELLSSYDDINVIYTRDKDVFIPLHERAQIANEAKADLFVSVHCNAHTSNAYGAETFVLGLHRNKDNLDIAMKENSVIKLEDDYEVKYDGFDPESPESYIVFSLMQEEFLDQSILLADFVQKQFTGVLNRKDRKVKQAGFLVLRETYMPSVLVETGFLTNKAEGRFLNSKKGQEKMSNAIIDGLINYKNIINLTSVDAQVAGMNVNQQDLVEDKVGVSFKVQIAASSNNLEPKPYNFNKLSPISKLKQGKVYKYFYGEAKNYLDAKNLKDKAKANSYKGAFIVAFNENNEMISIKEALNYTSK